MTSHEEIAAALQRLDARDREMLDLSLRRRVPDEDLADLYDWKPGAVAQRRAAAIERLSSELGVQRGAELGDVLKALLEPDTWALVQPAAADPKAEAEDAEAEEADAEEVEAEKVEAGEESAAEASGGAPRLAAVRPIDASRPSRGSESEPGDPDLPPRPVAPAPPAAAPPPAAEPPPASGLPPSAPPPAAASATPPEPDAPVLDMLADRGPGAAGEPPQPGKGRASLLRTAALVAILAASVGAAGVALLDGDIGDSSGGSGDGTRPFMPATGGDAAGPAAEPFPTQAKKAPAYPTAYLRRANVLRRSPSGKPLVKIARRTEWDSPRILGVVRREGSWLAVLAPELRNGQVGWIRAEGAQLEAARYSVHVDRSRRELVVRKEGRAIRRLTVAVGQERHPTPLGRFAVTDKLNVTAKGSPYGCCVVALTGHQSRLPPDWPGGDRLAIHATTDEGSIGKATSLGCMRTTSERARWLVRTLPIGSPVFIKR